MATPRETWDELGARARVGLIAGAAGIALFTAVALWWLLRDGTEILFSGLEAQDAAAVVAELERMKVPYEIDAAGSRILVPGSQVDELRLKLAGSGLAVGGGVGFEVFDDSDFGVTEFAQRINFQRAMQGELARTIGALREVERARVHLVMPQQSLFAGRRQPASAAVNVVLARGEALTDEQVAGIQRLVAASVEGLEPSRVTLVDQDGVTLSRAAADPGGVDAVSARLQKKQEVERYLRDKVASVLERSLGADAAVVSVDVSLAMDQVKTTLQKVMTQQDGSGWLKRRRETRNWTAPEGEATGEGGFSTETEYDLGRQIQETVAMPGGIERLSVGVLLPGPVAEAEIGKIREMVAMTVGLSVERGDSIAVHAIERRAAAAAPEAAQGTPAAPVPIPRAGTPSASRARPAGAPVAWIDLLASLRWAPALFAILLALALLARWTPLRAASGLSGAERKRLLVQLRGWIRADASGGGPGKTP